MMAWFLCWKLMVCIGVVSYQAGAGLDCRREGSQDLGRWPDKFKNVRAHRDRSDDIGELSGLIALFPPPVICNGRVF